MKAVAETLGVSRSNIIEQRRAEPPKRVGRRPLPEGALVADIRSIISELPTYGYRRVHALLRGLHMARGEHPPNHKRVYRVMKAHGLLLARHTGALDTRAHDGTVAVEAPDSRWCSDGFEIGCDNGERVRVAFSLDCCDREAMAWVATTGGISGEHIRDLLVQSIEHRFGKVPAVPKRIEWLSDNGSPYLAFDTRRFASELGFIPRTTPVRSPQSNGMAEAFVKTFKRDYVSVNRRPDAISVLERLSEWFQHYNEVHPHKALGYRSPRNFRRELLSNDPCPVS